LPVLAAVVGLELFPQVPEGEALLSEREREREREKVGLRDPPYLTQVKKKCAS
jgi:hypothetical protein